VVVEEPVVVAAAARGAAAVAGRAEWAADSLLGREVVVSAPVVGIGNRTR